MKKLFAILSVFILFSLNSCSDENNEIKNPSSTKDNSSLNENNSITSRNDENVDFVTYGNIKYYKKNDTTSEIYTDGNYSGDVSYFEDFDANYTISKINDVTFKVQNKITGYYFYLNNLSILGNTINFDLNDANGVSVKNIKYFDVDSSILNNEAKACGPCVYILYAAIVAITEITIHIINANSQSDCNAAIQACLAAGGKPSTIITDDAFGYSCAVQCN